MSSDHGGNIYALSQKLGCRPTDIIDVSNNINPLGPMLELMDHLRSHLTAITVLPDTHSRYIIHQYAVTVGLEVSSVVVGVGTTQLIHALFPAL